MNEQYPSKHLERALNEFTKLPGIGRRTALRLVLHLLKQDEAYVNSFAESLIAVKEKIHYCNICHNISDTDICEICSNPLRDQSVVCVVENISGVLSIENTGAFRGLYHVLGGVISPMDGVGPSDLEIDSLIDRVASGKVKEIIFALNPTMEGDTTIFFIQRKLAQYDVKLTTLARGVSVGEELEYTDEITLGRSITERIEIKQ